MEENLDQISPLLPLDFFELSMPLHRREKELKKKHLLPELTEYLYEDPFAKVYGGWDELGLYFTIEVKKAFQEAFFPNVRKGDSVELMIDTRALKTAGVPTRFCHHFIFLPRPVEGVQKAEITSFRGEDRHELCEGEKLKMEVSFGKRDYTMHLHIPADCLEGYDPSSFDRLGFTYRINRYGREAQHFALSSNYLSIESQPSLWATLDLN